MSFHSSDKFCKINIIKRRRELLAEGNNRLTSKTSSCDSTPDFGKSKSHAKKRFEITSTGEDFPKLKREFSFGNVEPFSTIPSEVSTMTHVSLESQKEQHQINVRLSLNKLSKDLNESTKQSKMNITYEEISNTSKISKDASTQVIEEQLLSSLKSKIKSEGKCSCRCSCCYLKRAQYRLNKIRRLV